MECTRRMEAVAGGNLVYYFEGLVARESGID